MIDLAQSFTIFIDYLKKEKKSQSTILAYGKDLEQFIALLKKIKIVKLEDLQEEHIKIFLETLTKKKYTPKSISRKLNSIRTFCKIMKQFDYMKDNPSINITHPKIEIKPPRVLSKFEYSTLRDTCKKDIRLNTIIEIMLQTGIRIGELARLEADHLNLDSARPEMKIVAYSNNRERWVPLNDAVIKVLKQYLKIRGKSGANALFITKTGNPLLVRNIRTSINRAFQKAEIENAKVNDLRNTFIAHNLAHGANLLIISQIVGHKRISTTEKYLGLVEGENKSTTKLEEL